jgi:hypothetical protein
MATPETNSNSQPVENTLEKKVSDFFFSLSNLLKSPNKEKLTGLFNRAKKDEIGPSVTQVALVPMFKDDGVEVRESYVGTKYSPKKESKDFVQGALLSLGYLDPNDQKTKVELQEGKVGEKTTEAIKKFQRSTKVSFVSQADGKVKMELNGEEGVPLTDDGIGGTYTTAALAASVGSFNGVIDPNKPLGKALLENNKIIAEAFGEGTKAIKDNIAKTLKTNAVPPSNPPVQENNPTPPPPAAAPPISSENKQSSSPTPVPSPQSAPGTISTEQAAQIGELLTVTQPAKEKKKDGNN